MDGIITFLLLISVIVSVGGAAQEYLVFRRHEAELERELEASEALLDKIYADPEGKKIIDRLDDGA